jgi:DNA-binding transcriptional LysR family regulator
MLNLVLLRTFVEIVEHESFSTAAENLFLTPSAVSGHIRRLESMVGKPLIARTTRSMQLTCEGELLYSYAYNMLLMEQEVMEKLSGGNSGAKLRVGASEDFASTWLPQVLGRFQQSNPGLSIELRSGVTEDLLNAYGKDELDVVIGEQCRPAKDGEPLWTENIVWAGCSEFTLDAAAPVPIVVFPEPCNLRAFAQQALVKTRRKWQLVVESASFAGCVSAARAGLGLTPMAESQVAEGLRIFGPDMGLPLLPKMQYMAFHKSDNTMACDLVSLVRNAGAKKRSVFSASLDA